MRLRAHCGFLRATLAPCEKRKSALASTCLVARAKFLPYLGHLFNQALMLQGIMILLLPLLHTDGVSLNSLSMLEHPVRSGLSEAYQELAGAWQAASSGQGIRAVLNKTSALQVSTAAPMSSCKHLAFLVPEYADLSSSVNLPAAASEHFACSKHLCSSQYAKTHQPFIKHFF